MDFAGTILEAAILLVTEIVNARRQLLDAPEKLLALVDQVEHAQSLLLKVRQANIAYGEEPFQKCLHDLGALLLCAQEKIDKYKQQSVESKNKILEIAKSTFGQGAAKQNLKTEALRERIGKLLGNLNQLLAVKIGCDIGSVSEVVKLSHSVNMDTNDKVTVLRERVSLLQDVMNDTKLKINILEKTLSQHTLSPKAFRPVEVPGLILKLNALASASLDDEECTIDLEIADSSSNDFHPPLEELDQSIQAETADRNQRAAEKGGYEIANRTKVRFTMGVEENRYFYVIMYDALEENDPSLYFPEYASYKNELTCKFKRRFPEKMKYACDPVHMVITKSKHLGEDAVGRHNLYIVLTCNKLHPDTKNPLQVKDIEENIEDGDFVKHFVFDIH